MAWQATAIHFAGNNAVLPALPSFAHARTPPGVQTSPVRARTARRPGARISTAGALLQVCEPLLPPLWPRALPSNQPTPAGCMQENMDALDRTTSLSQLQLCSSLGCCSCPAAAAAAAHVLGMCVYAAVLLHAWWQCQLHLASPPPTTHTHIFTQTHLHVTQRPSADCPPRSAPPPDIEPS